MKADALDCETVDIDTIDIADTRPSAEECLEAAQALALPRRLREAAWAARVARDIAWRGRTRVTRCPRRPRVAVEMPEWLWLRCGGMCKGRHTPWHPSLFVTVTSDSCRQGA